MLVLHTQKSPHVITKQPREDVCCHKILVTSHRCDHPFEMSSTHMDTPANSFWISASAACQDKMVFSGKSSSVTVCVVS